MKFVQYKKDRKMGKLSFKEKKMFLLDEKFLEVLCDPETKEALKVQEDKLVNNHGISYEINNGIPNFNVITDNKKNNYALNLFEKVASTYDDYHNLNFDTFNQNEESVRNAMIDKLGAEREHIKILELNAGTGRDSVLIKKKMNTNSQLYVQDISKEMLDILQEKMGNDSVFITQSNACALPYKDNIFDAIYSFNGVGMGIYTDVNIQMSEICRVAKKGAKVVIGGWGIAPWLYNTEFANILINQNKHYMNRFDFACLPVEARNVEVQWILNGAGCSIQFEVGEGEPEANFDIDIPGSRGGTLRTRYYGKLEGVSPETKKLALKAREKLDISMYDFLNKTITEAAKKIIEE